MYYVVWIVRQDGVFFFNRADDSGYPALSAVQASMLSDSEFSALCDWIHCGSFPFDFDYLDWQVVRVRFSSLEDYDDE